MQLSVRWALRSAMKS